MSFPEDEGASEQNPLKQTAWYRFLPPLLLFAGIGAVVWTMATGLFSLGEENSKDLQKMGLLKYASTAAVSAALSHQDAEAVVAGQTQAAAAPADAPAAPSAEGSGMIAISPADQAPAPEPVFVTPASRRRASEWRLRGAVYDLTTLRPLAGCRMGFSDPRSDRLVATRTDAAGRYRLVVPPLDGRGYAVSISKAGYAPVYLDPGTEGVRAMSPSKRAGLAKDLAATLGGTPAEVQGLSDEPLITDFYLAPRP